MIRRSISAGLALAVAVAFTGCGGATSQGPGSGPSQATTKACAQAAADAAFAGSVTIKGFTMSPKTVSIKVNETVAWTNDDSPNHTATMDNGDCSTDNIASGTTAKLTFTIPGTYTYHCRIHSAMTGFTVEVTG